MAQSGLHIPAESGSDVAVFGQICADIGDEQSIEQSLSTFSSHMTHIVDIIDRVDADSLVLLDELGAGTDPQEGAALAMAILETLHSIGARTVATTHYSELKVFAHTTEGLINASVEFDVETLRPTYRLSIGVPGSSNAFAIAERLGLPADVLQRARSLVGTGGQRMELMITNLRQEHDRAEVARSDAEKLRSRYLRLKDEYDEETRRLRSERSEIMKKARAEAETIVQEARKECERIIAQLRSIRAEQEQVARGLIQERAALESSVDLSQERALLDEGIHTARRDVEALREVTRELTAVGPVSGEEETGALDAYEKSWDDRVEPGDEVEVIALGQAGLELVDADNVSITATVGQGCMQVFDLGQIVQVGMGRFDLEGPEGVIVEEDGYLIMGRPLGQDGLKVLEDPAGIAAFIVAAAGQAVSIDDGIVELLGTSGEGAELKVGYQVSPAGCGMDH